MLACSINAACLALINAGVPMKFTIAAVNCMIQEGNDAIILDPDETQLQVRKYAYILGRRAISLIEYLYFPGS